ncbi:MULTISPECIES: ABC transporter ATP-binding protein [Bacteria]|jgi:ABC-type bacteriocin/lantibiotic exporter with double-glycine peptidase domain|nr:MULTISPECIES: ABC transporter ATP-binding protein [Bacteria]NLM59293.1 ABC transporter ATP-binding protein [Clostridium sp.]TCW60433.1 hypothetical protein C5O22_11540 [Treponema sp. J25]
MKRALVARIILCIILFQIVSLSYPLLTGLLVDRLVKKEWNLYIYCLTAVLFIPFAQGFLEWRKARGLTVWSEQNAAQLRLKLISKLFNVPIHYFSFSKTGEIITRCTDDVKQFIHYQNMKFQAFEKLLILVFVGAVLGYKNIMFMLFVFVCGLLYVIQSKKISPMISKLYRKSITTREKFNEFIRERIQILSLTRLSGCSEWECEKLKKLLDEEFATETKNATITFINDFVSSLVRSIISGALYLYAGWLLVNDRISLGDLVAALAYYFPLIEVLNSYSTFVQDFKKFKISKERVDEILNIDEDDYQAGEKNIPRVEKISFQNISFNYPNRSSVLKDISFTLEKGKVTALVGVSGGGKTTLCELLLKFYKPCSGKILINDSIDLAKLDGGLWRESISYAPQNSFFFSDSISANLLYGSQKGSKDRMMELTKRLELDNVITSRENGYETQINNDFITFSGGQKQRLSLVRAMIPEKPDVLILDEPTSALDYISEKAVMKLIFEFKEDTAVLIIAHRLSTIINADLILVLKDGMIVEKGRHEELLKLKGEYYNLYKHELIHKKEVENVV